MDCVATPIFLTLSVGIYENKVWGKKQNKQSEGTSLVTSGFPFQLHTTWSHYSQLTNEQKPFIKAIK